MALPKKFLLGGGAMVAKEGHNNKFQPIGLLQPLFITLVRSSVNDSQLPQPMSNECYCIC